MDGIGKRIEAADQEVADAEIVIVGKNLGDLLGRSDERSGVAVRAGKLCNLGPQPLVDARALVDRRQQPLGALVA